MYWMVKYRYYIQYGKPFRWRTDNDALRYVKTMTCPSGIIDRWLNTIADFHFEVEHRAGKKHTNADGMSRLATASDLAEADPEDDDQQVAAMEDPQDVFHTRDLFQHTREEIRQFQEDDEDLEEVR